ncbi:hypothetical protein CRE_26932 [Caenorhabditis remanei]|uniref:CCHC-type domain-containing protein n=1 Tax=Caenorhabditis remanei TaxID=31234 RepID=E3NW77_CAERE|nr:hypothetical protein CRE_26932 [Caenorhabditis remanei]
MLKQLVGSQPSLTEKHYELSSTNNTGCHPFPSSFEPNGPILTKPKSSEPHHKIYMSDSTPPTLPNNNYKANPATTLNAIEAMLQRFGETIKAELTQTINIAVKRVDKRVDKTVETQRFLIQTVQAMRTNLEIVQDQLEQQQQQLREEHSLQTTDPQSTRETHQLCPTSSHNGNKSKDDATLSNKAPSPESPSPLIQSPSPTHCSPISTQASYHTDLTTIFNTLKPFSGDTDHYSLFITRFNSLVHSNPSINTILKQNILISLLEGDSKDLITSDELSESAYEDLRANLERVYNRKTDRRKQLIENYRNLPFHQTDYIQMDKDVMKHVCLTNSLQKCQVAINDPFLIDTFVDKLPARIMRSFIKMTRHSTPSFLEAANLVQTLISENRAVDEAEQRKKNRTQVNEICMADINKLTEAQPHRHYVNQNNQHNNNRSNTQTEGTPKLSKWKSAPCIFCHQDHASNTCTMPIKEKRDAITKQNRCLSCFRRNHKVTECPSSYTCITCSNKHHSSICPEKEKVETQVNCLTTNENIKQFFRSNGIDM